MDKNQDLVWFMQMLRDTVLVARLKQITLVVTDIDGSVTDGNVFMVDAQEKHEIKGISMADEFAIHQALKQGLTIAVISGRVNDWMKAYARRLAIPDYLYADGQGDDKRPAVQQIQRKTQASREQTILFGDDFLDFQAAEFAGIYAVPINAPFYLQGKADLVMPRAGGDGALRLLLDLLLYVQKKHFAQHLIDECLSHESE